jgi:hypothetical protein
MSRTGFDVIAQAIDTNLDHLHKQRWNERAAELHAEADSAPDQMRAAQTQKALRDHYADRFRPETSRAALLGQATANRHGLID